MRILFWKKKQDEEKPKEEKIVNKYASGPIASFSNKDEVPWDQLPEQMRKHYEGGPHGRAGFLKGTQAVLMFSPKPYEFQIDRWEKIASGDWVLVSSGRDDFVMRDGNQPPDE